MEDKYIRKIADELIAMNKKFERLIQILDKSRTQLEQPTTPEQINIGSEGEAKQSEK
jgi:hypothetical protein